MHMPHRFLVVLGLACLLFPFTPAGRVDTYPRANELDVLEYTFRVTLTDESDAIRGLASVDLRWLEDGVRAFELDLASAEDGTGMTVAGVWVRPASGATELSPLLADPTERGARAPFTHEANRLRIELPEASTAGERSYVTVEYSGVPASGLEIGENHHGERCFFSENWPDRARQWMPTIDHPYDKAMSRMIVVAPDHYQVVSNGRLVETTDLEGGRRRTHWRQSVPIATWLYNLGVARFAVQHLGDFEGVPVQTWVYAKDRDAGFHDFAAPTHSALRFFSERVGPYEYEKLANVQCASIGGGMESASAIFYGQDLVDGTRSVRLQNVVVHELAHQWFGNSVTESDWDDVWLSEGFATYFTLLYREHARGREDFVEGLRDARERVARFYADRPDYRVVHEDLDDMSQVTTGMQYQKGAWILHMLRRQLGTETYWLGIRDYYAQYRGGIASTADFQRVMEERSGQELGWFFEQWLNQGGLPTIEGTWRHTGGTLALDLRQTQEHYRFRLPLELRLDFADGTSARETVWLEGERSEVSLEVAKAPVRVTPDPDTWLLAVVELAAR